MRDLAPLKQAIRLGAPDELHIRCLTIDPPPPTAIEVGRRLTALIERTRGPLAVPAQCRTR